MADIVQLKENGVSKYLQTHVKAVEGLETELAKKQDKLLDTGWVKIGFSGGVSSSDAYIKRKGDTVSFKGWLISPAEKYDIWTIPTEFRPSMDAVIVVLKDDTNPSKMNLQFNKNGTMRINFNSNLGANVNLGGVRYEI